jgi:hypothetical protein
MSLKVVAFMPVVAALALSLASCGGNVHSTEAVRQGVVDHLSSRKNLDLDLSAMDLQVTSVSFRQNEADATISFRPRSGNAQGMSMRYTLELKGSRWVVKNKSEAGASPHGAGAGQGGGGGLPAGHPPVQQPPPAPKQ